MSTKVFRMLDCKKEWEELFPELSRKAIGQCVLAEKKESVGDNEGAEAHLLKAIKIQEVGE